MNHMTNDILFADVVRAFPSDDDLRTFMVGRWVHDEMPGRYRVNHLRMNGIGYVAKITVEAWGSRWGSERYIHMDAVIECDVLDLLSEGEVSVDSQADS